MINKCLKGNARIFENIVWAFISVQLFPRFISDNTVKFTNSIFSVLLFVIIIALLNTESKQKEDRRLSFFTHFLGFLLSSMVAFGYSLDVYGSIKISKLFFSIIVYSHIIAKSLSFLWRYLFVIEEKLSKTARGTFQKLDNGVEWVIRRPVVILILLLICWLPAFIADFPGGFRYDATKELNQSTNGYIGDFPLLHSAIVTKMIPAIFNLSGSYNTGIAVYVGIQMIILSGMYTHMICVFARRRVHSCLLLFIFLYCGFFPVIQILVVQEVRDVLFCYLLMYVLFWFYLFETDKKSFFKNKFNPVLLALIFVLMILSRNNNAGIVAFLIIILFSVVVWLFNWKKHFGGVTVFSVSCIALYLLFSILLSTVCQPFTPAKTSSSLSLEAQSLARAYLENQLSQEEIEQISKYMYLEDIEYVPEIADRTKGRIHIPTGEEKDFYLLWLKTGVKHIDVFFDAILANTQNMWFPPSIIDGYKQLYRKEGEPYWNWEKCYYSITDSLNEPAEHMHYLPAVLNYYTQIGLNVSFERIPIVSMFFSIGFQFWMLLNCLFYNLFRKNRELILPICILLLYMLISAFAPLVILRYFAAIFFCVPMILVFTLQPSHYKKGKEIYLS